MKPARDAFSTGSSHTDFKGRAIRGGAITIATQFAQLFVYTCSTIVLARLLSPEDYGLVGMVTAVTGFVRTLRDAGLTTATVQREVITRDQISTVFWINISLGGAITLLAAVLAPALAAFYREPRLYWVTLALAVTFLLDAATGQHEALLRRQMRFKALAIIEMSSMISGLAVSISMALTGFHYWALVAMPITQSLVNLVGVWLTESWRPGLPRRNCGVRSMVRFGGYLTGVNLLNYSFRNADNILIGWYWGAGLLGLYQKAYSLLMLPISQVNSPISGVAVTTLSRIQSDPERQRRYFIGGYTIAASITIPIIVAITVFAEEVVQFVLGAKWGASVEIFRLLAPAALIGALLNPFGWLFVSSGRTDRQLMAGLMWCPLMVMAFGLGLAHGPKGVAIAYSIMSAVLAFPLCWYALRGTLVRVKDLAMALRYPVIAGTFAGFCGVLIEPRLPQIFPVGLKAIGGCLAVICAYAFVLLVIMRQWKACREIIGYMMPDRGLGKT